MVVTSESGHEIRCDVFVDRISTIKLATTTRTVYLEDAPEVLDVHAFDSEGSIAHVGVYSEYLSRECLHYLGRYGVPLAFTADDFRWS